MKLIIALLLAQAPPPLAQDVRGGAIELPPRLVHAFRPYMLCTLERTNERLPASDADAMRAIRSEAIAACADVRARGFAEADAILRRDRRHRDAAARRAYIEGLFGEIDRSMDPLIAALERLNAPAPAAKGEE